MYDEAMIAISMEADIMFGLGKAKAYREKVWGILTEIGVSSLLPQLAPLNAEIEKFRWNKFSEHSAVILLCYSSAMSLDSTGNPERGQILYDKARNHQDDWIKKGFVDAGEARGFNKYIAENSKIVVRP